MIDISTDVISYPRYQEKLEDIKEAIRSCKSKMDRKYNSKKNDSRHYSIVQMFLKFTEILEVQQNNTCTFTSGT
jgi:hypothetical protein